MVMGSNLGELNQKHYFWHFGFELNMKGWEKP